MCTIGDVFRGFIVVPGAHIPPHDNRKGYANYSPIRIRQDEGQGEAVFQLDADKFMSPSVVVKTKTGGCQGQPWKSLAPRRLLRNVALVICVVQDFFGKHICRKHPKTKKLNFEPSGGTICFKKKICLIVFVFPSPEKCQEETVFTFWRFSFLTSWSQGWLMKAGMATERKQ